MGERELLTGGNDMKRHSVVTWRLAAALALLVAGVTLVPLPPPATAQEELSGNMAVSVEAWMVDKYNMKDLIARFEQAHPKAKVKLLAHEGLGAAYQRVVL
jgi:ABC-type glycerol-3-phosphate transport system substrate-binding protein